MPGDYIGHLLDITPGGFSLPVEADMLKRQFDLEKPLILRFALYLSDIFSGDWGRSFAYAQPVSVLMGQKFLWTLILLLPAKLLSLVMGVIIGAYSGWHVKQKRDFLLLGGMLFVNAVPPYAWALLSIFVFAFHLNLFSPVRICGYGGFGVWNATGFNSPPWDVAFHCFDPLWDTQHLLYGTKYHVSCCKAGPIS